MLRQVIEKVCWALWTIAGAPGDPGAEVSFGGGAVGASRLPDVPATAVITVLTLRMQDFTWSGPSEPAKVLA